SALKLRIGERGVEGAAFIEGFLVFGGGVGVPGDAAADVVGGAVSGADDGADGDVEVGVAVETDPAERAGVGAAGAGFEFGDDLHGADLGRAGDGAAGEGGAQAVDDVEAGAKLS